MYQYRYVIEDLPTMVLRQYRMLIDIQNRSVFECLSEVYIYYAENTYMNDVL